MNRNPLVRTGLQIAALVASLLAVLPHDRAADAAPPAAARRAVLSAPADAPLRSVSVVSPLTVRSNGPQAVRVPGITALALDAARLQSVKNADALRLDEFPVSADQTVSLALRRVNVFSPGATLVVGAPVGSGLADTPLPVPQLDLFSGSINGEPESLVYLAFSDRLGVNGIIDRDGRMTYISSQPSAAGKTANKAVDRSIVLFDPALAPPDAFPAHPFVCQTGEAMRLHAPAAHDGLAGEITNPPCRVAHIAVESDYEYAANLFAGDLHAAGAYAGTLFGAISEIYQRDLNTRLEVNFLRLWSTPDDPWNVNTSTGDQLLQFQTYWNQNMGFVQRTAAHFLSGRGLGGGVAYVGALCAQEFDYGLSANLGGSFPYPLQHNNDGNWDVIVVAHEIGHNFGAWHTHDLTPPPDSCGDGDCTGAANGTIMSYCHTCPGGLANMRLEFHHDTIQQSLEYLTTTCDLTTPYVYAQEDYASTIGTTPILIDVLANDLTASCSSNILIEWFDTLTEHGGTVSRSVGTGPGGRDQLLYSPPAINGVDTFAYSIIGPESQQDLAFVSINVVSLRTPENPVRTLAGVNAAYFTLAPNPSVLPDFNMLSPSSFNTLTQVNLASTGGNFAGSGLADNVGSVITGFVTVPGTGVYTFFSESDDGSDLWIGAQRVVANDGLHGMLERSGTIPLQAGTHAITLRFFEAGGGAGLIARYSGPGVAKQVIPPGNWLRPLQADITADGHVDIDDYTAVVLNWGPCPPGLCTADTDHDHNVEIDDFTAVILNWD